MKEVIVAIALVGSSAVSFMAGWMTRSYADTGRAVEVATQDVWPQAVEMDSTTWPPAFNSTDGPGGSGLVAAAGSTPAAIPNAQPDSPSVSTDKLAATPAQSISSDSPDANDGNGTGNHTGGLSGSMPDPAPVIEPAAIPAAATLRPVTSVSKVPPEAPLALVQWHRTLTDARKVSQKLYVVINDTAAPPETDPPKGYAGVVLGSHDLLGKSTVAKVFQVNPPAVAIVEGERIMRRQNVEDAK